MSANDLPKFDDKMTYLMSGKILNMIIDAIKANQILSISGMNIERTPGGIIIKGS